MEDIELISNLDWDPDYLATIFDCEFEEMSALWNDSFSVSDSEILQAMDTKYCPVIDDISISDDCLTSAIEAIKNE